MKEKFNIKNTPIKTTNCRKMLTGDFWSKILKKFTLFVPSTIF